MNVGPVVAKCIVSQSYTSTSSPYTVDITDAFKKGKWIGPRAWFLSATKASGTGNCDVDIQVSQNNGTTKPECISFTQLSTTGTELKAETIPVAGEKVYAIVTISSTANYTINQLSVAGQAVGSSGI